MHRASFSHCPRTLPPGIELYRYTAGFLHQKVVLVGRTWATVGTANLDNRSFRMNFGLTLLNEDAGLFKRWEPGSKTTSPTAAGWH